MSDDMPDDLEVLFAALDAGTLDPASRGSAEALLEVALSAPPVAPAPDGLGRLMAALDAPRPFAQWLGKVADLLAVSRERARMVLDSMDDPGAWDPGPRPWVQLLHLTGTVGVEGAVVGFVRVEAGRTFPHHHHFGDEHVLVLEGTCTDASRTLYPGDVGRMAADSAHALRAGPDEQLVYLAVVFEGLEVDGEPMRP